MKIQPAAAKVQGFFRTSEERTIALVEKDIEGAMNSSKVEMRCGLNLTPEILDQLREAGYEIRPQEGGRGVVISWAHLLNGR